MSTIARFSLGEYDRIVATGVFDREPRRRVELIDGEIRDMNPIGPFHEEVVDKLIEWCQAVLPPGLVRIRIQNSIGLPGLSSVPQPDLAWVRRADYSRSRPTADDVLLVVEVADSSLDYDRGEKARLYAAAGIADYWVVNLPERCVEVFRQSVDGQYRTEEIVGDRGEVRPLAVPDAVLVPGSLWDQDAT